MERFKIDEDYPLQARMVSNMIEQSQHRIEGANFDVRKHLLEYDDVLNTQRARIYSERDRIFVKEDLTEDVTGMLRTELASRVPEALKDEGGPWKLLAWLDQVQQPPRVVDAPRAAILFGQAGNLALVYLHPILLVIFIAPRIN